MPNASLPIHTALCIASNIPSEQRVTRSALSRDPSRLELREMGLEEADLVFSVDAGSIGHVMHDAEMIPNCSLVDCCNRLGDPFGSAHVLAIPISSRVQSELGADGAARIGGVLVGLVEIDVRTHTTGSMLLESATFSSTRRKDSQYSTDMDQLGLTKTNC
jgi:hypothetical protein